MIALSRVEKRHLLSPEDKAQAGFLHVEYVFIFSNLETKFSADIYDSQRINIHCFGDLLTIQGCVVISGTVSPTPV